MATIGQIRGMLLEEAILYLLRWSGYKTVEIVGTDPTLHKGSAGMEVRGRGGIHQIDAIADLSFGFPFSYPQRLLVEAKCYAPDEPVGIEVARNSVGVAKDASEFWTASHYAPFATRYHYLPSIFSATPFTEGAQHYAFAQDVYLFPMTESAYARGIVTSIRAVRHHSLTTRHIVLNELRKRVREDLATLDTTNVDVLHIRDEAKQQIRDVLEACYAIRGALVAMLAGRFPILLVPSRPDVLSKLSGIVSCRFFYDHDNLRSWYLCRASDQRSCDDADRLFSFDLPDVLLSQYMASGTASGEDMLNLKAQWLHEMQTFVVENEAPRLITFRLDPDWLHQLRQHMQVRSAMRRPTNA